MYLQFNKLIQMHAVGITAIIPYVHVYAHGYKPISEVTIHDAMGNYVIFEQSEMC